MLIETPNFGCFGAFVVGEFQTLPLECWVKSGQRCDIGSQCSEILVIYLDANRFVANRFAGGNS